MDPFELFSTILFASAVLGGGFGLVLGLAPNGWFWRELEKSRVRRQELRMAQIDNDHAMFVEMFTAEAKRLGMQKDPEAGGLPHFTGTRDGVHLEASAEKDESTFTSGDSEGGGHQLIEVVHGILRVVVRPQKQSPTQQASSPVLNIPWKLSSLPDFLLRGPLASTIVAIANLDEELAKPSPTPTSRQVTSLYPGGRRRASPSFRGMQITFAAGGIQLRQTREGLLPELEPLCQLATKLAKSLSSKQLPQRLRAIARAERDPGNEALAWLALAGCPDWGKHEQEMLYRSLVQLDGNRGERILKMVAKELSRAAGPSLLDLLADEKLTQKRPLSLLLVRLLGRTNDPRSTAALVSCLSSSPPQASLEAARTLVGRSHLEAIDAIREAANRVRPRDPSVAAKVREQSRLLAKAGIPQAGGRLTVMAPEEGGKLSLGVGEGELALTEEEPAASEAKTPKPQKQRQ